MTFSGLLALTTVLLPAAGDAASAFELRDQDRVVFLGGSLTAEREAERYEVKFPTMVESFVRARYPTWRIEFFNRAISEDHAVEAAARLAKDVLSIKPTVAVLCFGESEVRRVIDASPEERADVETAVLSEYADAMRRMTRRLIESGCRVWLISPPAADEHRRGELQEKGFNRQASAYVKLLREISDKEKAGFIDWYGTSTKTLAEGQARDGGFSLSLDGVRPSPMGHGLLAATLLQAWRADPYDFTITVDWADGTVDSPFPQTRVSRVPEAGQLRVDLKNAPLFWPLSVGRAVEVDGRWPVQAMTRLRVRIKNGPEIGLLMRQGGREVPVLAKAMVEGVNLATLTGFCDVREASHLLEQIIRKNRIRDQGWQDRESTRPAELELQPAHDQFMNALDLYGAGYAEIIERLPRSFDVAIEFRDITAEAERSVGAEPVRPKVGRADP